MLLSKFVELDISPGWVLLFYKLWCNKPTFSKTVKHLSLIYIHLFVFHLLCHCLLGAEPELDDSSRMRVSAGTQQGWNCPSVFSSKGRIRSRRPFTPARTAALGRLHWGTSYKFWWVLGCASFSSWMTRYPGGPSLTWPVPRFQAWPFLTSGTTQCLPAYWANQVLYISLSSFW